MSALPQARPVSLLRVAPLDSLLPVHPSPASLSSDDDEQETTLPLLSSTSSTRARALVDSDTSRLASSQSSNSNVLSLRFILVFLLLLMTLLSLVAIFRLTSTGSLISTADPPLDRDPARQMHSSGKHPQLELREDTIPKLDPIPTDALALGVPRELISQGSSPPADVSTEATQPLPPAIPDSAPAAAPAPAPAPVAAAAPAVPAASPISMLYVQVFTPREYVLPGGMFHFLRVRSQCWSRLHGIDYKMVSDSCVRSMIPGVPHDLPPHWWRIAAMLWGMGQPKSMPTDVQKDNTILGGSISATGPSADLNSSSPSSDSSVQPDVLEANSLNVDSRTPSTSNSSLLPEDDETTPRRWDWMLYSDLDSIVNDPK
jgi:hypothetical protein